jgi:AhpD family alkylhydroperoxidase
VPLVRSLPENATLADLRARYADLLELFRPYGERLMRGPSPFSASERELIAAYVSGLNSCRFCFGVHSRVAEGFGMDGRVFTAFDAGLVHAIAVCAYFNMMNRLVEGAGIVGDPESYALAASRLVEQGYDRRA